MKHTSNIRILVLDSFSLYFPSFLFPHANHPTPNSFPLPAFLYLIQGLQLAISADSYLHISPEYFAMKVILKNLHLNLYPGSAGGGTIPEKSISLSLSLFLARTHTKPPFTLFLFLSPTYFLFLNCFSSLCFELQCSRPSVHITHKAFSKGFISTSQLLSSQRERERFTSKLCASLVPSTRFDQ